MQKAIERVTFSAAWSLALFSMAFGVMVLLSGCAGVSLQRKTFEAPPVIVPQESRQAENHNGSLWAGNDNRWSMTADVKACRPGDLLTVNIIDRSEGESTVESKGQRKSSILAGIENFFGKEANYGTGRLATGKNADVQLDKLIKADSTASFESDGEAKQDHKLIAEVSAQVVDVLPGGVMKIYGYKVTGVGREQNYITVEGLLRPEDLDSENQIDSTRLANATIIYGARGPNTGDLQSPGIIMRGFYKFWPF
ncbi:flagellar basal body L-ring protein FlgH [Candidatus Sumerlaeota bacterium]|nr:flagellar basal body L-ring protein FlgH [Candidatus Sumerlaeota bacterium]